jgi:hypothetical protein
MAIITFLPYATFGDHRTMEITFLPYATFGDHRTMELLSVAISFDQGVPRC